MAEQGNARKRRNAAGAEPGAATDLAIRQAFLRHIDEQQQQAGFGLAAALPATAKQSGKDKARPRPRR